MTDLNERWPIVGQRIRARMTELGLTKAELTRRSGVTDKTLDRYLEGAPIVRADKAKALCAALGWSTNAIEQILAGAEPVTAEEVLEELTDTLQSLRDDGKDGADRAAEVLSIERQIETLSNLLAPPQAPPFRSRLAEAVRREVHQLVDDADEAGLTAAVKGLAWASAEARHGSAYWSEMEDRDEPWWAAAYPPSIEEFFAASMDLGRAFEVADEWWAKALAEFEAEADARGKEAGAQYLDLISDPDYEGPGAQDLDDFAHAAGSGDVSQLDDLEDPRGGGDRPQPPPMSGDEGA